MMQRGVLLDTNGLHPTAKGARIRTENGQMTITDGPFAETKELIAGYWLIQANSKAEAIERFRSCPFQAGELELRQFFDAASVEARAGQPAWMLSRWGGAVAGICRGPRQARRVHLLIHATPPVPVY